MKRKSPFEPIEDVDVLILEAHAADARGTLEADLMGVFHGLPGDDRRRVYLAALKLEEYARLDGRIAATA